LEIYLLSYEINEQVHASCCLMNRFTDHVQFCEAVQPSSFKKDPTQKPFVHRYGLGVRRGAGIASQYISLACLLNFETATSITHRDAADWKLNKATL